MDTLLQITVVCLAWCLAVWVASLPATLSPKPSPYRIALWLLLPWILPVIGLAILGGGALGAVGVLVGGPMMMIFTLLIRLLKPGAGIFRRLYARWEKIAKGMIAIPLKIGRVVMGHENHPDWLMDLLWQGAAIIYTTQNKEQKYATISYFRGDIVFVIPWQSSTAIAITRARITSWATR